MRSGDQPPSELLVGRTRASRLPPSNMGSRDNLNNTPACERLIDAERGNPFLHDLADKPSARILIETEVNGRVDLFQFISFRHAPASSQRETKDNVL